MKANDRRPPWMAGELVLNKITPKTTEMIQRWDAGEITLKGASPTAMPVQRMSDRTRLGIDAAPPPMLADDELLLLSADNRKKLADRTMSLRNAMVADVDQTKAAMEEAKMRRDESPSAANERMAYLRTREYDRAEKDAKVMQKLVDHLSTPCLADLD